MKYGITSASLSVFNADGTMIKTVKSAYSKILTLQQTSQPVGYHAVSDVGMSFNKVTPGGNWSDYATHLITFILKRHPEADAFHCINDIYEEELLQTSVKQHEQERRSKKH